MQDVVAHTYNLSNQEAKAGELPQVTCLYNVRAARAPHESLNVKGARGKNTTKNTALKDFQNDLVKGKCLTFLVASHQLGGRHFDSGSRLTPMYSHP